MISKSTGVDLVRYNHAMQQLVAVVQDLSQARDLDRVMAIVRHAARDLMGADGASFILRDGDQCYYADEEAISPLWKGSRFPMKNCISGWVMEHKQPATIPDIYVDPRIPTDAYRPTFVKSLVVVPIRSANPIGAIGVYWADIHQANETEIGLLQSLADTTAVSMVNVGLLSELETRVKLRTAQLEAANAELEAFSYSVAHDLRTPLQVINISAEMLQGGRNFGPVGDIRQSIERISNEVSRMSTMIEDLLRLASYTTGTLCVEDVDVAAMAQEIVAKLQHTEPQRRVEISIQPQMTARGDSGLLKIALENLLSNAWKYTGKKEQARISLSMKLTPDGMQEFELSDNGAGFDMRHASRLFLPFNRLHNSREFKGAGVGLATVKRILRKHGGTIRAESAIDQGSTFRFTLPVL